MLETILAALKAVPLIVEQLEKLSNVIENAKSAKQERELNELKEELNALTQALQNSPNRDRLRSIVRRINKL